MTNHVVVVGIVDIVDIVVHDGDDGGGGGGRRIVQKSNRCHTGFATGGDVDGRCSTGGDVEMVVANVVM